MLSSRSRVQYLLKSKFIRLNKAFSTQKSNVISSNVSTSVPSTARTVIIGGGAIGSSVAYHLSKFGRKDIVVLEQGTIGCGTTWHAAGLVGQLRNTPSEIYLSCYGSQLYSEMEAETGQSTGFKGCGSLTLAQTDDRIIALCRNAARAKAFNIEAHIVSPEEANKLLGGLIETSDLKGALWLPGDGTVSPTDLTAAYVAGAKQRGVKICEQTAVLGFVTEDSVRGRVTTVRTDKGEIQCEEVVNCAGQWARNIGLMAGVNVPLHSAEHFYVITEPYAAPHNAPIPKDLPLFRDPDSYTYFREWSGGLCAGGFEPVCKPCFSVSPTSNRRNLIPPKFEFQLFQEDWDHFNILMEGALKRIPSLGGPGVGIRQMVNGPESFTADNQYILGEAPERRKFYVAAGFNSSGIASSGGAGKALAEWIINDKPTLDLWTVDIRRFSPYQNNGKYLHDRTLETLGLHYQISYPKRELESSRLLRKSALYELLKQRGAVFGSKFGWERPNYFNEAVDTPYQQNLTFGRPHWFDVSKSEHEACRNSVALFDQSSFAKLLVKGTDAAAFMQRLCSNDMDVPVGKIVYTGLLNDAGGMESDITVTRVDQDEFLVVTSTAQGTRELDWINKQIGRGPSGTVGAREHVVVVDVTSSYAVLSVMGPLSRKCLAQHTTVDLSNEAFPFGTSQLIDLGYATVRANRITYVGELGWELVVPTEMAVYVYELLAGVSGIVSPSAITVQNAGYYAIDSLRMEKGYRAWGHELSSDWTPYECGLGFAVKLSKPCDFIGKAALQRIKENEKSGVLTPQRKLMSFVIDDPEIFPWGSEAVLCDGETVGFVTSAAYGHTLGRGVVFAMLKLTPKSSNTPTAAAAAATGKYQIDFNGKLHSITPVPGNKPAYDPSGSRIKC